MLCADNLIGKIEFSEGEKMNDLSSRAHFRRFQRIGRRLILAGGLALALTMPSGAEDRAVKQRVQPVYPEVAKRMRVEGVVKLSVTVDAEGKVLDVKTVSGNHMLSIAAEDSVRRWKFEAGAGVSTVEVSMNFALQ
jgi:TonB family protein